METLYYRVLSIDGDYAHMHLRDDPAAQPKMVARALLPAGIREGSMLKSVFLEYELVE